MESRKKSILCVDDDEDSLELLKIIFEEQSYEVCACKTLEDCLQQARQSEFSAIILDNHLGNGTSLEVCREIRSLNQNVPIIFCSGEAREAEINKAIATGGDAYFVKPLDFDQLIEKVNRLIQERQPAS